MTSPGVAGHMTVIPYRIPSNWEVMRCTILPVKLMKDIINPQSGNYITILMSYNGARGTIDSCAIFKMVMDIISTLQP